MSSPERKTFVVEVGVEEIPSQYLPGMGQDFGERMMSGLRAARLAWDDARAFYTPRRLIWTARVAPQQAAETEMVRGPAVAVAFKEGAPTPALEGFLRRVGLPVDALERQEISGKEYLLAPVAKAARSAEETLPEVVAQVLGALPQPRAMRWRGDDTRFVRPVRWLTLLLDNQVLKGEALGVEAGSFTYGNRTDHPDAIDVQSVDQYWQALTQGMVMWDPLERHERILLEGRTLAEQVHGEVDFDAALLDEVTNLVEWPTPFVGGFDPEFLEVPEPILITSMRVHQRYFPVRGEDGRLSPHFIAVRNGKGAALDLVRRGNEKVLRARLSDARYFYDLDRREPLAARRGKLAQVTVHAKLGTYADKVERVLQLFQKTRAWWPLDAEGVQHFEASASLYKCDLLTHVVGEFPELQGEMGAIYAGLDGSPVTVQEAIRDQYRPGFPGDRVPHGTIGQILGLLDRVDTLMAFYQAGIRATGSEDPFGLRRTALGLGRIAAETPILKRPVRELLAAAADVLGAEASVAEDVYTLVKSRMESFLAETWPASVIAPTLARVFPWTALSERLAFLKGLSRDAVDEVSQAYKRVHRIARDAEGTVYPAAYQGVEATLAQKAEACLAVPAEDLSGWWQTVASMLTDVAAFFEDVLVMDPDPAVRAARLGLVVQVGQALGRYYAWDLL